LLTPSLLSSYVLATGVAVVAVLLRWLLQPWLGPNIPYGLLFGAVAIAVWHGGYRAGMVAMAVAYLGVWALSIPSGDAVYPHPAGPFIGFVTYLLSCFTIIGLGEAMRGAQSRAIEVQESAARLAAIVTSSDDAILSKDLQGTIKTWNRGAERIFGYTEAEAVGKSVFLLIPEDRRHEEPEILGRIGRGERIDQYETIRRRKDGSLFPVSLTVSPVLDPAGRVIGASKIARDISDQKRFEAELKEADRRKDEFLATLAHELRNPLAPLRTGLYLLRQPFDAKHTEQTRAMMERQLTHMVRLIDDLLDVSRISTGRIELRKEDVDVASAIGQATEAVREMVENRKHTLEVTLPRERIRIRADQVRLAQIVTNLLTNAAKFTETGGVIRLTVTVEDGELRISVKDNGIGLAPEHVAKIFEMFSQVDKSLARSQGGLGIGLALTRSLVVLHGGSIEARSEGLGKGTEFLVRLPLS
jgi:PAS domain S-box-containing protein